MTTRINITRKRGDTKAIIFQLTKGGVAIDISLWSNFLFTVDPEKAPVDALNNIFQASGFYLTDGTDGLIAFTPPGDTAPDKYFYDAQGIDPIGGKCTFAEGSYKLKQDITKD